ncbi:MAG: hypothetical protein AAB546_02165 [Patescibacteria group bacterium]
MSDLSLAKIAEAGFVLMVGEVPIVENNLDGSQSVSFFVDLAGGSFQRIAFNLDTGGQKVEYHPFRTNLESGAAGGLFIDINEKSRLCMVVSQKQYLNEFRQRRLSRQLHVLKVDPNDPNIKIVSQYPPHNEHVLENSHITGAGIEVEGYTPLSNDKIKIVIDEEGILISTS